MNTQEERKLGKVDSVRRLAFLGVYDWQNWSKHPSIPYLNQHFRISKLYSELVNFFFVSEYGLKALKLMCLCGLVQSCASYIFGFLPWIPSEEHMGLLYNLYLECWLISLFRLVLLLRNVFSRSSLKYSLTKSYSGENSLVTL